MMRFKEQIQNFLQDSSDKGVKRRQDVLFFGGLTGIFVVGGGIFLIKSAFSESSPQVVVESVSKRQIETAKASVDVKKVWVDRLESDLDLVKKKNEQLEALIETMAKKQLTSEVITESEKKILPAQPNVNDKNPSFQLPTPQPNSVHQNQQILSTEHLDPHTQNFGSATPKKMNKLAKISFKLEGNKRPKKTIEHYVPAGTFVKARLTSGVVALTATSAASNPLPVHMELINFGNLPREFKTDLKSCFVIGAAYGELPSERVYIRLETLSCVERKTQEVIELKVDGHVNGEDGATGMRGHVIDKSGPAMRNAFLGGMLGGIGEYMSAHSQPATQISPFGVTSQNALKASQMVQGGAGKGIGNAMEKMADFYIKRAELLQPVIEIEPGREVDVVFKVGFDMNQTLYREALKKSNDRARLSDVSKEFNPE